MENKSREQGDAREDEFYVAELISFFWKDRAIIAWAVIAAAVVSLVVALSLPNKYKSEALLAPRSDGLSGGGLGQLASQYGGLASLAGVNLGGLDNGDDAAVALEMLKSRVFFREYLYEEILVDLMAATGWDAARDELEIDEEIYDSRAAKWVREVSGTMQPKPSLQEAHSYYVEEILQIKEDIQTGFVKVEVTHYSPNVAKYWLNIMIHGINDAVRSRDILEAEKSIAYLTEQSQKTPLVSLTAIFSELIEEQTKTVMLANVSKDYVFRVIDPPVAPQFKSGPQRALICIFGVLIGLFLSLGHSLYKFYSRRNLQGGDGSSA